MTNQIDYRSIARQMTLRGYPMNHSSARNYVLRGVEKIADKLSQEDILPIKQNSCAKVSRTMSFQDCVGELLYVSSRQTS